MKRKAPITAFILTTVLLAAGLAIAQSQPPAPGGTAPPGPKIPTVTLTISPRPVEKPALEYSLMFRADETRRGNAAVKYLEAFEGLPSMNSSKKFSEADDDALQQLRTEPLEEMDEKQAQDYVNMYGYAFRMVGEGARLDDYHAEIEIREKGYAALLPSLGRFREIVNMLAIHIRLDIRHHRWTQAREKLATGYGMAFHLARSETVIEALVGASMASNMTACLDDWVQQGGPNLYWDLVNLPHPFVDMRRALAFERATAVFSFPELKEMQEGKYSADRWISLCNDMAKVGAVNGVEMPLPGGPGFSKERQQVVGVLEGVIAYPRAKAFLQERGITKEDVQRMPVPEVLGRYFVRSYNEAADEVFKVLGLPPAESQPQAALAEKELEHAENPMARMLIPSLGKAQVLAARVDRNIDMLRIAEALRAQAAAKGALPDKLDDLELPVPTDPLTDKPFEYRRDGDTATLTSPAKNPRDAAILQIRLKR